MYYLIKLTGGKEIIMDLDDSKDVESVEFQPYHGSEIIRTVLTQSGLDKVFSIPSLKDSTKSQELIYVVVHLSEENINKLISVEEDHIKQSEQRIAKLVTLLPSAKGKVLNRNAPEYLEL